MPYVLYHEPLPRTPSPPPSPLPLNHSFEGRDGSEVNSKGPHPSLLQLVVEPTNNNNTSAIPSITGDDVETGTGAGTGVGKGVAAGTTVVDTKETDVPTAADALQPSSHVAVVGVDTISAGGGPMSSSGSSGMVIIGSNDINLNIHTSHHHNHHDDKPSLNDIPLRARIITLLSTCMSGWGMFYMGIFIALPMFFISLAVTVVFGTIIAILTYPVYAVRRMCMREYPWPDAVTTFGKNLADHVSRWTWCGSGSCCCHRSHPNAHTTTRSIWPCFRGQGLGPGIAQGQGLGQRLAQEPGLTGRPRPGGGMFGHWFRGNNARRGEGGDHHQGVLGRPVVQSSSSVSLAAHNETLAMAALNQQQQLQQQGGPHGSHINGTRNGVGGGAGIGLRLGIGSGSGPMAMTSVVNGGLNR